MYHEYRNITEHERYTPYLSRGNGGKKLTKKLKDVFLWRFPFIITF